MAEVYFDARIHREQLQKDIEHINNDLSKITTGFERSGQRIDNTLTGIGTGLKNLVPAASLASAGMILKQIAADSFNFANEFSKAMREVQTISQAVQQDFKGISQQIIDMAANGPEDAIKLSKAYYEIVSAGYDGSQALEILRVSTQAATAGITDTKIAADGLTTILNAWGKDASEAGKVADIMFKTVEKGKTTFPELASNIAQVAPMAAAMNISFEEIAGAIASLTKQGTTTPMALTQIRSAMQSLTDVLGDGWSKSMTFQEALQKVRDMAGGSEAKLNQMAGRVEAFSAILALTGEKATEATKDLNDMATATGATLSAYDKMMLEADNKWSQVHNKWARELKAIGDLLSNASVDIADKLNDLLTNRDADIIAPEVSKTLNDFTGQLDSMGDREAKLKLITDRIIEIRKATQDMGKEAANLEKLQPNAIQKGVEAFNAGLGLGSAFTPGRTRQVELEIVQDDIEINNRVLVELGKLYDQILNGTEVDNSKNDLKEKTDQNVKTVADAIQKIKDLTAQLGTGTIEQDVQIILKIGKEQEFVDNFNKQVREKLNQALNVIELKPIELKSTKGVIVDKQKISDQLKPMKQLNAEEVARLELLKEQFQKIEDQRESFSGFSKEMSGASEVLSALSFAVGQLDDNLGKAVGKMADFAYNAANVFANISTGNIVGAVSSGIGALGNLISLFIGGFKQAKTEIKELRDAMLILQSIDKAKSNMLSGDWTRYTEIQLSALQQNIEKSMKTYDPYGLSDAFNLSKISLAIDYWNKVSEIQGGLTEDQQKILDQFIDWQNQYNQLQEEALNRATGTTRDAVADSIIDGFKQGFDSAADFAETFEDLMKKAIVNAFKTQLIETDLMNWYKGFAEAGSDGYTEQEINYWRAEWQRMIELQNQKWQNIEKITGVNPTDKIDSSQQGLTGAIKGITEETAGLIAGQFFAFRELQQKHYLTSVQQLDVMNRSASHLAKIEENTRSISRLNEIADITADANKILKERL